MAGIHQTVYYVRVELVNIVNMQTEHSTSEHDLLPAQNYRAGNIFFEISPYQ